MDEEDRLSVGARLAWLEYARRELRALEARASAAMTLLALEHVGRRYRQGLLEHVVLRDVSLELGAGELVAVWGVRRSGRSTLLRIAAGIERPTRAWCASRAAIRPGRWRARRRDRLLPARAGRH